MPAPASFRIIGIAALLWNLLGDLSFIAQYLMAQYRMNRPGLVLTDPVSAHLFAQTPGWIWAIFALSVLSATLATLLLLMRRAIAVPLYLLSTLATFILFGHSFLATDMLALHGWGSIGLPLAILLLGLAQLAYARTMQAKGILR